MPYFSDEELAPLSDEVFEKFLRVVATYHERIESQCEINQEHDRIHVSDG